MPGLRDILEAATPGPWVVQKKPPWIAGRITHEDATLIALAPELAAWGLDVFERHAHLLDDDLLNRWQEITGGE